MKQRREKATIQTKPGKHIIKGFEGERRNSKGQHVAYKDSAGVWTIGWGHTGTVDGKPITKGMTIDDTKAEALFQADTETARAALEDVKVPLNPNQEQALESFVFNVGSQAFADSTLLRKLNAGDYDGASNEFMRWVHAGGKKLKGLERRRAKERDLFRNPDYPEVQNLGSRGAGGSPEADPFSLLDKVMGGR